METYKPLELRKQNFEKLLAQTNLCDILVDDGSTDHSGEFCGSLAEKHPNIAVIHRPNGSVSSARNAGMEAAGAEFIAFADPDDWLESGSAGAAVPVPGLPKSTK